MGRAAIERPVRLSEKLRNLRKDLSISQYQMIRYLGYTEDELTQSEISAFERGTKLPSFLVLLRYARKFNISVEALIDDELEIKPQKKTND